jgi:hypothetical protein
MKKTVRTSLLLLLLLVPAASHARACAELFGAFVGAGDAGNQLGAGLGVAADITGNLNVIFRGSYSAARENGGEPSEVLHGLVLALAGIEYLAPVAGGPFFWITGLAGGGSYIYREQPVKHGAFTDFSNTQTVDDIGPAAAAWTGVLYQASQRVSLFLEAGYHMSLFFTDYEDEKIRGVTVLAGARFTISGSNRSIYDGY